MSDHSWIDCSCIEILLWHILGPDYGGLLLQRRRSYSTMMLSYQSHNRRQKTAFLSTVAGRPFSSRVFFFVMHLGLPKLLLHFQLGNTYNRAEGSYLSHWFARFRWKEFDEYTKNRSTLWAGCWGICGKNHSIVQGFDACASRTAFASSCFQRVWWNGRYESSFWE